LASPFLQKESHPLRARCEFVFTDGPEVSSSNPPVFASCVMPSVLESASFRKLHAATTLIARLTP
jgi:hypothetical protein